MLSEYLLYYFQLYMVLLEGAGEDVDAPTPSVVIRGANGRCPAKAQTERGGGQRGRG